MATKNELILDQITLSTPKQVECGSNITVQYKITGQTKNSLWIGVYDSPQAPDYSTCYYCQQREAAMTFLAPPCPGTVELKCYAGKNQLLGQMQVVIVGVYELTCSHTEAGENICLHISSKATCAWVGQYASYNNDDRNFKQFWWIPKSKVFDLTIPRNHHVRIFGTKDYNRCIVYPEPGVSLENDKESTDNSTYKYIVQTEEQEAGNILNLLTKHNIKSIKAGPLHIIETSEKQANAIKGWTGVQNIIKDRAIAKMVNG